MARTLSLVIVLLAAATALAGNGAGELSLDRGAVTSVITSQLPASRVVTVAGLGQVTVRFDPPQTVDFLEGTVEARLGLRLVEAGVSGTVLFRLRPEVDTKSATVRLRATRAKGEGPFALIPDVATLLPPITMPHRFDWVMANQSGVRTAMGVQIQEVVVRADRLVIRMGLRADTIEVRAGARP